MSSEVRITTRGSRRAVVLVIFAVLGLLVAAAIWAGLRLAPVSPRVVEGWAQPNGNGTAVGLLASPDSEGGEGYAIAGAEWRGVDGRWHSGTASPTCVGTDTTALTHVRLGVVLVRIQEGPTKEHVVWLECLE